MRANGEKDIYRERRSEGEGEREGVRVVERVWGGVKIWKRPIFLLGLWPVSGVRSRWSLYRVCFPVRRISSTTDTAPIVPRTPPPAPPPAQRHGNARMSHLTAPERRPHTRSPSANRVARTRALRQPIASPGHALPASQSRRPQPGPCTFQR